MKTYSKIHTNKKAADTHLARIKSRGGTATMTTRADSYKIEYTFPEKVVKEWTKNKTSRSTIEITKQNKQQGTEKDKNARVKKLYDVLSPDGKTIRKPGDPPFTTLKARQAYFDQWKDQHHRHGYWSPNKGSIIANKLRRYCKFITLK